MKIGFNLLDGKEVELDYSSQEKAFTSPQKPGKFKTKDGVHIIYEGSLKTYRWIYSNLK